MGAYWDLIQKHLDTMEFAPSNRRLALRLGIAPTTLTNWRNGLKALPDRDNIEAVADFIGRPYQAVLDTALAEIGYAGSRDAAARKGKSGGRQQRHDQDRDATSSQDPGGMEPS